MTEQLSLFTEMDFHREKVVKSDTNCIDKQVVNTTCTALMVIPQADKRQAIAGRVTHIPSSRQVYLLPPPMPPLPERHVDDADYYKYEAKHWMPQSAQTRVRKLAKKLRKSADSLDKQSAKWRAPRLTNTVKRIREWEHNMDRANKNDWLADKYRAIADYIDYQSALPKRLYEISRVNEIKDILEQDQDDLLTDIFKALGRRDAGQPSKWEIIRRKELAIGKITGFFPTPDILIEKMLSFVEIKRGTHMLEPSAGRGDIAQYVRDKHPEVRIDCVEWSASLREILDLKDLHVIGDDIFTVEKEIYGQSYDVILMNPPFENANDAAHVMYVYEHFLRPGGVLVAITSASTAFHNAEVYKQFRQFIKDNEAQDFPLPDGSFKRADVSTGVATRMVVVAKLDENGNRPTIHEEDAVLQAEFHKGQYVRHTETGEYATVMSRGRPELMENPDEYHIELVETMNDLIGKGRRRKFRWHVSHMVLEAEVIPVKLTMAHLRVMQYSRSISDYINHCNLYRMGYHDSRREAARTQMLKLALHIAYNKADACPAVQYIDDSYEWSSWFSLDELRKESPLFRDTAFDALVNTGYLLRFEDKLAITEAGCDFAGLKWSEIERYVKQEQRALCGETAIVLVSDPLPDNRLYKRGKRILPSTPSVIEAHPPVPQNVLNAINSVVSGEADSPSDMMKAAFGLLPGGDNLFKTVMSALDDIQLVEKMIEDRMKKHYLNEDMMARLFNSLRLYQPKHALPERLLKAHMKEMLDRIESGITRQSLLNRMTDAELLLVMRDITLMTPICYSGYLIYVELFHRCCPHLATKIWNGDFKRPVERMRVTSVHDEIEDLKDKYRVERGHYDPKLPEKILPSILGEKKYAAYKKKKEAFETIA